MHGPRSGILADPSFEARYREHLRMTELGVAPEVLSESESEQRNHPRHLSTRVNLS